MEIGGSMLSSLSLTGSDGIVRTSGNQTIRGVKTFLVNPLSATVPTTANELVNKIYADSLVATGSSVVHRTGNLAESIDGLKTFTNTLTSTTNAFFNKQTFTYEQYLRLGAIAGFSFFDYRSGGNSSDYDVRVSSTGGTSAVGYGNYAIEAGTNTLDTKTTNTLAIGGTAKITTTSADNTLSNTNNSLNCGVAGYNKFLVNNISKMTITTNTTILDNTEYDCRIAGSSKISCDATDNVLLNLNNTIIAQTGGSNVLQNVGTAKITTTATENIIRNNNNLIETTVVSGANTLYASGGLGVNLLWAGGTSGYNSLYAQGTGAYNLIETTGTGTNTIRNGGNTSGTANLIEANGAGGGNYIKTGLAGVNRLEAYDNNSSNLLAVNGSTKIQTTYNTNTINNTTNILSVSGTPKITTTSTDTTLNNTNANIIQIAGTEKLKTTSADNTFTNTNNVIVGNFITPSVKIGTLATNVPLCSSYFCQTVSPPSGGGVYCSFGSGNNNGNLVGLYRFPFNITIKYITAHSSQLASGTAQQTYFYFDDGTNFYSTPMFITPIAATAQSLLIADNITLNVNAGVSFYHYVDVGQASTPCKSWNFTVYYIQR